MLSPLRRGELMTDDAFDAVYLPHARQLSEAHWTPVEVAVFAAEFLVQRPGTRVLDVGSGAGKFCQIGALVTQGTFIGVEQRPVLLHEAERVCRDHGIDRAAFLAGNAEEVDWSQYDAFYLFNPFLEHLTPSIALDDTVALSARRYELYVAFVEEKLRQFPGGTRVVTYYGFGGAFPRTYQPKVLFRYGGDYVIAWEKQATETV